MEQSEYRVVVSQQAVQMLASHAAFLAQVSPPAAERLIASFEKAAHSLEHMPQRCAWFSGSIYRRIRTGYCCLRSGI